MQYIPKINTLQYLLLDVVLKAEEEKELMLEYTKRLSNLISSGPHEKEFMENATKSITDLFWGAVGDSSNNSEKSDDEVMQDAESALSLLKF